MESRSMPEREQVRYARRRLLDAKLKTRQGREEIVTLWRTVVPSPKGVRDDPSDFQVFDAILDREKRGDPITVVPTERLALRKR